MYIHLQKRRMKPFPRDLLQAEAWYITPHEFVPKTSEPEGPSEMDKLNSRNMWFDKKRMFRSLCWRVKWRIAQTFAPWPRRV